MTYAFLNKASNWVKSIAVHINETDMDVHSQTGVSETVPQNMFGMGEHKGAIVRRPVEGFEGLC